MTPIHPELLTEEDLETYFEELCHGEYRTLLSLDMGTAAQVTAFTLARICQLWVKLEQRIAQ